MPKHRILDILKRKSHINRVKTQSELTDTVTKIESTKKLESDLDFNIEGTIEIGVKQLGYGLKVNSQLRQSLLAQKEIVENRLEFLSNQQNHLQKVVQNEQLKSKKYLKNIRTLMKSLRWRKN